jgi:nucleoside-diphosphate-sugar epimerase
LVETFYVESVDSGLRLRRHRDAGHDVWCIRRNVEKLPDSVTPLQGDLTDPGAFPELPGGIDLAVYAAGAGGFEEAKYRAAYVDGPRNTLDALARGGAMPARMVFTSSTGVYHQNDGEWVDEESPTEPTEFSGKTLLEGERQILDSDTQGYVIRFGGIYGPGRDRLIRSVRDGSVAVPKDASYLNLIHRDDCARAIEHLLFSDAAPGIYNAVDDEPADRRELYAWIAEQLGVALPEPGDVPPSSRQARSNKRCTNTKIRQAEFEFTFPTYRQGLSELLSGT